MWKEISSDASMQAKLDNLILYLKEKVQKTYGEDIRCNFFVESMSPYFFGLKNRVELLHFIQELANRKLINTYGGVPMEDNGKVLTVPVTCKITYLGNQYCDSLRESGQNSVMCFIAMSFSPQTNWIYDEAIVPACRENGFEAIRVDKKDIESEQTINDFIIASIKRSRFCISDFTENRNGVYFETGYALGRGLKVIYTCHHDDFDNRHFDIKPLQFISYKTSEELKNALSLKIKSFILD